MSQVLSRNLPVVAVDQENLKTLPTVNIDDRRAAKAAAAHLLELNHRRLAVLAMDLLSDHYVGLVDAERIRQARFANAIARLRGYEDAIRQAGLD
ncbi:hypothetical protein IFO70_19230 [Phormidium tenue FACHB-886]|nr:hypothetical protein [Phormidium tenue FACHB-886]